MKISTKNVVFDFLSRPPPPPDLHPSLRSQVQQKLSELQVEDRSVTAQLSWKRALEDSSPILVNGSAGPAEELHHGDLYLDEDHPFHELKEDEDEEEEDEEEEEEEEEEFSPARSHPMKEQGEEEQTEEEEEEEEKEKEEGRRWRRRRGEEEEEGVEGEEGEEEEKLWF